MSDTIIIQHVYKGDYVRLLKFSEPYHREYANNHNMDYIAEYGNYEYDMRGDWLMLEKSLKALEDGYKYVIKLDADAIIQDTSADLREACRGVGVCYDTLNCIPHYNSGVMYFENTPDVIKFIKELLSRAPGKPWDGGPMVLDQGELNAMSEKYPHIITRLDNKWNSYAGTPCADESEIIVKAYHGLNTIDWKLADMKMVKGVA